MFLVQLIYASRGTEGLTDNDIEQITEAARRNNQALFVSGLLCYGNGSFLQCLEGSRSSVNRIYHKILRDDRHDSVVLLDYREITARQFPAWTMGYIPEAELGEAVNLRFSGNPEFDPFHMNGEGCHEMMLYLRDLVGMN